MWRHLIKDRKLFRISFSKELYHSKYIQIEQCSFNVNSHYAVGIEPIFWHKTFVYHFKSENERHNA